MLDKTGLKKWWDIFVGEGGFTEVRILGKFQYSGYFKSFDNLCRQLEPYTEMDDEQIYFVLNQIDESVYGRPQCEKFLKSVKVSTNDNDIVRRRFLMIDCDAIRKSSTNSSEEEYNAAIQKARDIFVFLREKGFPDPIVCTSGNGAHLQIPVDLPADEETTETIKRFYKYLASQFTDNQVDIDQKVYNLARLCKTYHTWAKKGANIPDRPWRKAEILYVPQELIPAPIEKIEELADLAPNDDPKPQPAMQQRYAYKAPFDIRSWLSQHSVSYREKSSGGSTVYELEQCPWIDSHSDRKKWDSAVFVGADGKITFNCTHSHCSGRTWRDFRLHYEPDAYSKPFDGPVVRQWGPAGQVAQRKPSVKEEVPELGSKWLSMSVIKKLNLDDVEFVATGFPSLDKDIYGLVMGEITILSGSTASGKSSLLNTILLNVADQGWKSAIWSGELPASMLKNWIQTAAAGRRRLAPSKIRQGSFYVPERASTAIDSWLDGKLYIYNNDYGTKWEQIFSDMETLLSHGVRVFVLDNLFTLDIDIFGGDTNRRQKELIIQVKEFAKKNSIHIILVAHPRKTNAFIRRTDISGSSDIANAADNVFIIHRVGNDFMKAGGEFFGHATIAQYGSYGNVIECCKNRLFGVADKLYGLYYDPVSRRFSEDIECGKVYGWEDMEMQIQNKRPEEVPERPAIVPDTSKWEAGQTEYEMGDPDNNFGYPY